MNKKQQQRDNIRRHSESLAALYELTTGKPCEDPIKLCKAMHRIERMAIKETTALLNGYYIEPTPIDYKTGRADRMRVNEEESEKILDRARRLVQKWFEGKTPEGFFINYDARGYALKIKNPPIKIYQDFGGYGILAPEF